MRTLWPFRSGGASLASPGPIGGTTPSTGTFTTLTLKGATSGSATVQVPTTGNTGTITLVVASGSGSITLPAATFSVARIDSAQQFDGIQTFTAAPVFQVGIGTGLAYAYVKIVDQKSSGTAGGTFTSGAWQTRTLNTKTDADSICTLSSNQFTLPAGTYRIHASAPSWACNETRAKLYNVTDSTDVLFGTSEQAKAIYEVTPRSEIVGQFTIAGSKTFEIQHRCATTANVYGFGIPTGFGDVEIYTQVEIWKVG